MRASFRFIEVGLSFYQLILLRGLKSRVWLWSPTLGLPIWRGHNGLLESLQLCRPRRIRVEELTWHRIKGFNLENGWFFGVILVCHLNFFFFLEKWIVYHSLEMSTIGLVCSDSLVACAAIPTLFWLHCANLRGYEHRVVVWPNLRNFYTGILLFRISRGWVLWLIDIDATMGVSRGIWTQILAYLPLSVAEVHVSTFNRCPILLPIRCRIRVS